MTAWPTAYDNLVGAQDRNAPSLASVLNAIQHAIGLTGAFNFAPSAVGGDLSGSLPNPLVIKLNGSPLGTMSGASLDEVVAWNGSAWVPVALTAAMVLHALDLSATASQTMSGPLAMGAHKITGLANGSAAQDAAAFGQIPTVFVIGLAAGDGSIVIGGTSTNPTIETGTLDVIATDHPPALDWSNNSHKIVSVLDPTNPQDVATKNYVDAISQGLSVKASVLLATAAALPANTYNNGTAGVGATLTANANGALTVDGTGLIVGNRILVKSEVAPANNGIYSVTQVGSGSAPYILTRTTDADAGSELSGAFTFVEQGTANTGAGFVQTTAGAITVGTTSLVWTQFSGAGEITVDASLTKSGNQLGRAALTGDVTASAGSNATSLKNTGPGATGPIGAAGTVPIVTIDAQGRVTALTSATINDATKLPLAGGTMSGPIAMGASKITGLANGSAAQDAAAFGQIPTVFVAGVTAGDTSVVVGGTASNPTLTTATLDVLAADHPPATDWSNNSRRITSVADPSGAQDAATKNYVDNATSIDGPVKTAVLLATTGALPANTYANGTAGVGATLTANANGAFPTIDGNGVIANNRLLVWQEGTATHNGIYNVTQVGDASHPYILTRATDCDASAKFGAHGIVVFVEQGSLYAGSGFFTAGDSPVLGTSPINWINFSVTSVDSTLSRTGSQLGRAALSGDITVASGSNTAVVTKVNGVAVAASPSNNQVVVASGPTTSNWTTIPLSIAATDTSIVVTGGTSAAPTIATGTLDVIATQHPPAANWSNNSHKITGLANGSAASDAAAFGQIPTALPPNGAAGGDLTGTYPNPTLAAAGPGATGPIGDGTHVATITIDAKGRVTALTSTAITGAAPSGSAGGDLSGTYPNPGVAKVNGVAITAAEATLLSQINGATSRTASATAVPGELSIITGTTAAQTLTLPTAPQASTTQTVVNYSTQNWIVARGGSDTITSPGTTLGTGYTMAPGQTIGLIYLSSVWYVIDLGEVRSFNGRVGDISPAGGDYAVGQITGAMAAATYDPGIIAQQVLGTTATQTVTNKRITRRVVTTTQSATPTINTDNTDIASITGLAQAITSFTTNLSGTPVDGDALIIRITDNGTARAITWGASFESSTVTLPATTVISALLTVGFLWNAVTSKWRCVAAV